MKEDLTAIVNGVGIRPAAGNTAQRSDVVQEIISARPGFIEKWGLLFCLGIFVLLLTATWFIQYPDVIQTRAILTAANAPKEIICRQEGRLIKICVHNGEWVSRNGIIGWMESTARHEDVIALSASLDSSVAWLKKGQISKVMKTFALHYSNLGELQTGYQQFLAAWQQFDDYMINGFYERKRNLLQQDIHSLDSMRKTILLKQELTAQKMQLAEESYKMNRSLLDEKVLSRQEFRVEKGNYLNSEMAMPELTTSLLLNGTQQRDKQKELEQLEHDISLQMISFQQALQSFRSDVDNWMKAYVLQSPVEGKVFFVIPLQENQFIREGRLLGYINPDDSKYYMETYLEQRNFGKIDTGLKVLIRFDAYPYQEAGIVEGTLNYVSAVPSDSGFLATIRLNNGLVTDNQKNIPFKSGLTSDVLIVTHDRRLLERFYAGMKILK